LARESDGAEPNTSVPELLLPLARGGGARGWLVGVLLCAVVVDLTLELEPEPDTDAKARAPPEIEDEGEVAGAMGLLLPAAEETVLRTEVRPFRPTTGPRAGAGVGDWSGAGALEVLAIADAEGVLKDFRGGAIGVAAMDPGDVL